MTLSYDESREEYYRLIHVAETTLIQVRRYIQQLTDQHSLRQSRVEPLPKKLILSMYKAAAHALIYRAEGYVCPSTIMHVVRTLQEHPEQAKRKNPWPSSSCLFPTLIAHCGIGPCGYILSMLEQQGYLLRFQLEYCHREQNYDPEKCRKKREKYKFRFLDALQRMRIQQRTTRRRHR